MTPKVWISRWKAAVRAVNAAEREHTRCWEKVHELAKKAPGGEIWERYRKLLQKR